MQRTREDVAAGAHGAADEHRLPRELVVDGDERVVRREGAGGALAVHQQRLQLPVHHVLLDLCGVRCVRGEEVGGFWQRLLWGGEGDQHDKEDRWTSIPSPPHTHHTHTTEQQQQQQQAGQGRHLCDVVRDVVDDVHVEVVGRGVEHLGKGLAAQEGHAAAVDPGVVGGAGHRGQVVLPLLRSPRWTGGEGVRG